MTVKVTVEAELPGSLIPPFEEILPVSSCDAPSEIIATSKRTRGFALSFALAPFLMKPSVLSHRASSVALPLVRTRPAAGSVFTAFSAEKRTRETEKATEEGSYLPTSH